MPSTAARVTRWSATCASSPVVRSQRSSAAAGFVDIGITGAPYHDVPAPFAPSTVCSAASPASPPSSSLRATTADVSVDSHTSAGIVIAAMSAVLTGTGTVVEKVALQRLPEIHARHLWVMLRTLCASPQWLWGCACLLGGLLCQGLALSLAPISVAQPIFASGIVLLLVLSHFVLHDRLRPVEWFALATIVLALVLLGLSIDTRVDHAGGPAPLGYLPACRPPDLSGRARRFHGGGQGPQLAAAHQAAAGPAVRRGRRVSSTAWPGSVSSQLRLTCSAGGSSARSLT